MQTLQASRSLSGRAQARPAAAGQRLRVKAAGLSPEQQAFLDRKAREARTASPAPSRGRSGSSRPPSMRPTSRPAPAAPSYSGPSSSSSSHSYSSAPAAPAANGLSAEQQAFLARKATEARSASPAAPAPTRGRSSSPRPSFRPSASPAPPASSYGYSAPASSSGLSAEQQAFLARKASESRSPSPAAPTRGRSSSPRPSFRASSSPAPAAAAPSSYSAPAPAAANGLSAEQQAFLARKATESRSPSPAAPTRGRSSSPRPSFRASSSPAPAAAQSSYSAPAPASYNPPAPAAPAANGLSTEQQEFLARKASESRSPPPAAPARGRSSSARPSSRQPSAAPSSYQPAAPSPPPEPRVTDVEFARAALERTIQDSSAVHPRDYVPVAAPAATGPSTGRWPDPAFFQETLKAFPAKAVCNAEEARCLIDAGYAVLDVRPELESNRQGKLRGSVAIPCTFQRQQFDSSRNEMVVTEEDNPAFLAQVARKFRRKDSPIIVACSNGKSHSIDVLEVLEEEGYTNIVGMMGGFNAFYRTFDNRLNPKDGRPKPRRAMKKLL
ncbi:hypothetical protein ABPG75_011153 [Micractinium tetrahymenae]